MRQITAKFPWYIQNLYFHDFIGNISTTNAIREEEIVKVGYSPRFPICGGWKTDWNQGYKMPTKYHLRLEDSSQGIYKLEIPFLYNYDVLLAENYFVEVILPYGASDIQFELPFEVKESELTKSMLTLDFFGTPKLVLKAKDVFAMLHNKNLVVRYRFDETYTFMKPIGLSLTVFAFYLAAILFTRIQLSFAEDPRSKVEGDYL
mmetsp:Transcript_16736/g.21151  ORF Transcript_16736/g.21151 Transcript_16736/m.21151 type:complete len:204 (+) Transcript_16736:847-1458(+)